MLLEDFWNQLKTVLFGNQCCARQCCARPRCIKILSIFSLLYSATAGDLTALKRFYYSGVTMSNANYDGRTALHLAAAEGHASCVKFLVETCKLNPLAKDRYSGVQLKC